MASLILFEKEELSRNKSKAHRLVHRGRNARGLES